MWKIKDKKLTADFSFDNFKEALKFVNEIGKIAEKENHHPDIYIHDYKNVLVTLFTHKEDKITDKDQNVAREIDKLFSSSD